MSSIPLFGLNMPNSLIGPPPSPHFLTVDLHLGSVVDLLPYTGMYDVHTSIDLTSSLNL